MLGVGPSSHAAVLVPLGVLGRLLALFVERGRVVVVVIVVAIVRDAEGRLDADRRLRRPLRGQLLGRRAGWLASGKRRSIAAIKMRT